MKYSTVALAVAAILSAAPAFASVLQVENSGKQVGGVTISKGATLVVSKDRQEKLITVGAGVRTALFGAVKAYVGELLVQDQNKYSCTKAKALDSLANEGAAAIRVTATFSFDKSKLLDAFNEGFASNNVDTNRADIQKFLAAVKAGGSASSGSVFVFAGERVGADELVTYEDSTGKATTITGKAGFIRSIFSLWLGDTDDSGLKDLNNKLTSCQI